jgi:hypothetical protein
MVSSRVVAGDSVACEAKTAPGDAIARCFRAWSRFLVPGSVCIKNQPFQEGNPHVAWHFSKEIDNLPLRNIAKSH